MSEPASQRTFRGSSIDWALRAVIGLAFLFWGSQKFSAAPGSPWFSLFSQVGAGQWLRYCTGGLEVVGAALTLYPRTVTAGLAVLGCVLGGAALIDAAVLRSPMDAVFPFAVLCALIALWMHRRER